RTPVAALGAQIVDLVTHITPPPMEDVVAPLLVPIVIGRVVEQPNAAQCATQGQAVVARRVVPEAIVPVFLAETMRAPSPVDERLVADARAVEVVTAHILVGDGGNGTGGHDQFSLPLPAAGLSSPVA